MSERVERPELVEGGRMLSPSEWMAKAAFYMDQQDARIAQLEADLHAAEVAAVTLQTLTRDSEDVKIVASCRPRSEESMKALNEILSVVRTRLSLDSFTEDEVQDAMCEAAGQQRDHGKWLPDKIFAAIRAKRGSVPEEPKGGGS